MRWGVNIHPREQKCHSTEPALACFDVLSVSSAKGSYPIRWKELRLPLRMFCVNSHEGFDKRMFKLVLRRLKTFPSLRVPMGRTALVFDAGWLVVIPAAVWAIAELYMPVVSPGSSRSEAFEIAAAITAILLLSLVCHAVAHLAVARAAGAGVPSRIVMFPLGDVAQSWEPGPSAWHEAAVALAGPFLHVVLAGASYAVLAISGDGAVANAAFFLMIFNLLLAAVNLTPAFPFDGGRLVRVVCWGLMGDLPLGNRLARLLGMALPLILIGWGIFLWAEKTRVSSQSSSATFVVVGLIVLGLFRRVEEGKPAPPGEPRGERCAAPLPGAVGAAVVILSLASITASLVPTNYGLEAPGSALQVEPMVTMPQERRNPISGSFYLTTVIPQTPIILGEWVYGHFDRAIKIVPPEAIIPKDRTPQQYAREQFRVLQDSETLAKVVALRMAGFDVPGESIGVHVVSVVDGAPAQGILRAGDVIKSVDGKAVTTTSGLIDILKARSVGDIVRLSVLRDDETQTMDVKLGAPAEADGAPRIGISILPAITGYSFPFEVTIVPQKTAGGPSAGLMFTLTVYNLVTPEDLTRGHKIAGTGTIDVDGRVGPIGGVRQKVVAAERAGAEYFLSPEDNYADATAMARKIKVVKMTTAQEAIDFLKGLPPVE